VTADVAKADQDAAARAPMISPINPTTAGVVSKGPNDVPVTPSARPLQRT
jgi:hypothetical protein